MSRISSPSLEGSGAAHIACTPGEGRIFVPVFDSEEATRVQTGRIMTMKECDVEGVAVTICRANVFQRSPEFDTAPAQ